MCACRACVCSRRTCGLIHVSAQESRKNSLRDFVSVAGPLGVSHFVMLSATDNSSYVKLAKTPRVRPCIPSDGRAAHTLGRRFVAYCP
jgi:hypothetical protein